MIQEQTGGADGICRDTNQKPLRSFSTFQPMVFRGTWKYCSSGLWSEAFERRLHKIAIHAYGDVIESNLGTKLISGQIICMCGDASGQSPFSTKKIPRLNNPVPTRVHKPTPATTGPNQSGLARTKRRIPRAPLPSPVSISCIFTRTLRGSRRGKKKISPRQTHT